MIPIADFIDRITVVAGKILACLILPLMLFVFANAMARYVFGTGHVWLFEAVGYCFAIIAVADSVMRDAADRYNEYIAASVSSCSSPKRSRRI